MKTNHGFTLIETIIYLGLFAILFGGAVVAAYGLFEGNARGQTRVMIQEEGNFLTSKISWAISGSKSIESPGVNLSDAKLSTTKWPPSTLNPVVIELIGGNMTISKSGGTPVDLNNTNTTVSNLNFTQIYAGGANTKSVKFYFTLTAKTPNGMTISQDFSGEKFIKK